MQQLSQAHRGHNILFREMKGHGAVSGSFASNFLYSWDAGVAHFVELETPSLVVVGSSPTSGVEFLQPPSRDGVGCTYMASPV